MSLVNTLCPLPVEDRNEENRMFLHEICSLEVKNRNLDINNEEDRRCLHAICYMAIAASITLGFDDNIGSITILHGEHGPFIPKVEEWCNEIISLSY